MTLQQIPNGPPLIACEALSTLLIAETKLVDDYNNIKESIQKVIDTILSIKYGIIDLADIVASELVTDVAAATSAISSAILQGVSGATNAILEQLLSELLSILLSYPDAIFSLVAIPLDRAKESALSEKNYLNLAQRNMDSVSAILYGWSKSVNGTIYYKQMVDSLPHIEKCLTLITQMLSELSTSTQISQNPNAVFDQNKYDKLKTDLRLAIQITTPNKTFISSQITKEITNNIDQERRLKVSKINARYKQLKQKLDSEYIKKITTASNSGNHLQKALATERLNLEWAEKEKALQTAKRTEVSLASADSAANFTMSFAQAKSFGQDIYFKFALDMNILANSLSDFLTNIQRAYVQNLLCQQFCNTVYNSRNLILQLIQYLLTLLRATGNASASIATTALEGAQSLIQTVDDNFTAKVDNYQHVIKGQTKNSASTMATAVGTGNILLQTAQATLTGLITDSLIALINSDDILQTDSVLFDKFIGRMAKIPDWDGEPNSWCVKPLPDVATSPYIQLVADVTSMITMVPVLSFSPLPQDKAQIRGLFSNVSAGFGIIEKHNIIVLDVTSSYSPYQCASSGRLIQLLKKFGLLDVFAIGLSLTNLVSNIIYIVSTSSTDIIPTISNCKKYYPDLFQDLDAISGSYINNANRLPVYADVGVVQKHAESIETSRIIRNAIIENNEFYPSFQDLAYDVPTPDPYSLG